MKAKIQAKIMGLERKAKFEGAGNVDVVGLTKLHLKSVSGKVDTRLNNAQLATMEAALFLKEVIADDLKIGSTITIIISDEDSGET